MNNMEISYIFHLCITPNHFLIHSSYLGVSYSKPNKSLLITSYFELFLYSAVLIPSIVPRKVITAITVFTISSL